MKLLVSKDTYLPEFFSVEVPDNTEILVGDFSSAPMIFMNGEKLFIYEFQEGTPTNIKNTESYVGYGISPDFGGYDCLLPKLNEDNIAKYIQSIGYAVLEIENEFYANAKIKVQKLLLRETIENCVLPTLLGKTITYGIGNYAGRSLGCKRGIEDISFIEIKTIEDLKQFAKIGVKCLSIK